jgi:hypothetical protein
VVGGGGAAADAVLPVPGQAVRGGHAHEGAVLVAVARRARVRPVLVVRNAL